MEGSRTKTKQGTQHDLTCTNMFIELQAVPICSGISIGAQQSSCARASCVRRLCTAPRTLRLWEIDNLGGVRGHLFEQHYRNCGIVLSIPRGGVCAVHVGDCQKHLNLFTESE